MPSASSQASKAIARGSSSHSIPRSRESSAVESTLKHGSSECLSAMISSTWHREGVVNECVVDRRLAERAMRLDEQLTERARYSFVLVFGCLALHRERLHF